MGFNLSFIKLEVEIGIGASINDEIGVQLFLKAAGEISAGYKVICDSPDTSLTSLKTEVPFKGEISTTIGFRGQVQEYVKLEACITSGFESHVTGIIDPAGTPIFSLKGKIKWTGVKGKFELSISTGKHSGAYNLDFEKDFLEAKDIVDFHWPGEEKKYNPPFTPPEDIKKIFEEQLTDWWNIRVGTKSVNDYGGFTMEHIKEMKTKAIINALVEPIIENPYMKTDKVTIKLLAQKVNEDLDKMGERDWERDYVDTTEFEQYIKGKYKAVLKNYEDQGQINADKLAGKFPQPGYQP